MSKIKLAIVGTNARSLDQLKTILSPVDDLLVMNDTPMRVETFIDQLQALDPQMVLVGLSRAGAHTVLDAIGWVMARMPHVLFVALLEEPDVPLIQRALAAGVSQVLVQPVDHDMVDVLRDVIRHGARIGILSGEDPRPKGRIITVYGTKGGVGKTMIAANLATALGIVTGRTVAAVDLDLEFGDLVAHLQRERKGHRSLFDFLEDASLNAEELLRGMTMSDSGRVAILPSLGDPAQLSHISPAHVKVALEALRLRYPFVLIDSHQSLDSDRTLEALDIADIVLVVTTPDVPTLVKTGRAFQALNRLDYVPGKVRLVINRSNTGKRDLVEKAIGSTAAFLIPSNGFVAVTAANEGVPFVEGRKKSDIKNAILHMAKELVREETARLSPTSKLENEARRGSDRRVAAGSRKGA